MKKLNGVPEVAVLEKEGTSASALASAQGATRRALRGAWGSTQRLPVPAVSPSPALWAVCLKGRRKPEMCTAGWSWTLLSLAPSRRGRGAEQRRGCVSQRVAATSLSPTLLPHEWPGWGIPGTSRICAALCWHFGFVQFALKLTSEADHG